jgi:Cof subfamily protein (haloacid dehalogenase superfamily)
MTYKLVALDIDGTTLNSRHELTEATAEAIRETMARGIHVVLATGKQYVSAVDLVHQLGLTAPQITSNGSLISDPKNDSVIFREVISRTVAEQAIDIGAELGVTVILAADGKTYTTHINEDIDYILTYGDPYPELYPNLKDALSVMLPSFITAIAYKKDELYLHADQVYQERLGRDLHVHRSSPYFIDMVHPNVSKGSALRHVGDMLGILPAEMLVIGDSFNDLSMFQMAGLAIAMGHAPAEVKAAAHEITKTNDLDGVSHALRQFILNS